MPWLLSSTPYAAAVLASLAVQGCDATPSSPDDTFRHAHVLATSTQAATSFTPQQLQTAYQVSLVQQVTPATSTIVIVAYHYPNAQSDFAKICAKWGFPNCTLSIVNQAGTVSNANWALEEMLDVEMVRTANSNTAITVIEARSNSLADLATALEEANALATAGTVVSMSFGANEYAREGVETSFSPKAGTTWVAASGDTNYPTFPATHPEVIAVGGASLRLNSDGTLQSETGWGPGGCGLSTFEPRPAYQDGINPSSFRSVPDVVFSADPSYGVPVYCSASGGWVVVGGTSMSAPFFAGMLGLVNSTRIKAGKKPMSSVANAPGYQFQPYLYELLSSQIRSSVLFDVTQGTGCSTGASSAGVGYDVVSGLGSVYAEALVTYLAAF